MPSFSPVNSRANASGKFSIPGTIVSRYFSLPDATQPATGLRKVYLVLAKGLLANADLEPLRRGVELTGGLGRSGPAEAHVLGHGINTTWLSVAVTEGKNREVRRLLLAIGSQAIRLKRVQIGGLELDLEEDEWRRVSEREVREKLGFRLPT